MNLSATTAWRWCALLYAIFCISLNWLLGVITDPNASMLIIQRRDIGAALALPSIAAFCFAVIPILINRAQRAILQSAQNTDSSMVFARVYSKRLQRVAAKQLAVSFAIACVVMFIYFYTEGLFYLHELSFAENAKRFPLVFQAVIMWTGMVWGIMVIFVITKNILRFMDKHMKVGVFSAPGLFPIANTVYWNSLFFCFGITLAPLFWLGNPPPMKDFLMAMTVLLILINLMFQPLMRANQIIVQKKKEAIQAYRQEKGFTFTNPQLLDNSTFSLQSQSSKRPTTNFIDEVISAREWPMNVHLGLRFSSILVLPFITWIGNTVMTYLVQY